MPYGDIYGDIYGAARADLNGLPSLDVDFAWDDLPLTWDATWHSVIAAVENITITRGKNSTDQDTYDTSTLTVDLDEADLGAGALNFNPINPASVFAGKLTSYRPVRVVCNDSTNTQSTMFRGHVKPRGWKNMPDLPGPGITQVTANDILAMCARYDLPTIVEPDLPTGGDQTLYERFLSVLVLAEFDWATYVTYNGNPGTIFGPTVYGGKLKQYLEQMALSDGGAVWCRQDGNVVLEQRHVRFFDAARTTPQATFADDAVSLAAGAVAFEKIELDYARNTVNKSRMAGASGRVQEVADGSIAALTGLANTDEHLDLFVRDDSEAHARADLEVQTEKDDWYGPVALTFEVNESNAALDAALNVDLRQRVRIKYTPPGLSQVTVDCFVEQIVMNIPIQTSPNTWKVTYQFSPCAPIDALDASTFWRWGTSTWGTGRWAP